MNWRLRESAAQLSRARLNATLEREQLARLMGLWGTQTAFALPKQLPAIPKTVSELRSGDDAEATALRERLDLRALRATSMWPQIAAAGRAWVLCLATSA